MSNNKPVLTPVEGAPNLFIFWCPGCNYCHHLDTDRWTFNGDMVKPTASPSLLIHPGDGTPRCHLFMRYGELKFLSDCTHELAGKVVAMIPIDEATR